MHGSHKVYQTLVSRMSSRKMKSTGLCCELRFQILCKPLRGQCSTSGNPSCPRCGIWVFLQVGYPILYDPTAHPIQTLCNPVQTLCLIMHSRTWPLRSQASDVAPAEVFMNGSRDMTQVHIERCIGIGVCLYTKIKRDRQRSRSLIEAAAMTTASTLSLHAARLPDIAVERTRSPSPAWGA